MIDLLMTVLDDELKEFFDDFYCVKSCIVSLQIDQSDVQTE